MHEQGNVETVDQKIGTGIVVFNSGAKSLFYLRDGREVEAKGGQLQFVGPRIERMPQPGDAIVCDWPGRGMVDHWLFASEYARATFMNWAATLQNIDYQQYARESYIQEEVLMRIQWRNPHRRFPRLIRRLDMDAFWRKLERRLPLALDIDQAPDWIEMVVDRAALECFADRPDGLTIRYPKPRWK